jgi:hypothetical protein
VAQRSDPPSDLCPKCNSHCLRPSYTLIDGRSVEEVKCLICSYLPPPSPPQKASIAQNRKRSRYLSKKRSHSLLTPRKPNKTADATDQSSYAASAHFWQRSLEMKKLRNRSKSKSERASLRHYQRLFDALVDTLERLRSRWARLKNSFFQTQRASGHASDIKDRMFNELQSQYWILMRQAMIWQPDDPMVQAFAGSRRALGNYEFLREARKGLETGVKRPYATVREALSDQTILDLGADGLSPGKIQKALKSQGLHAPSREGIRKRLAAYSIPVTVTVSRRIPRQ